MKHVINECNVIKNEREKLLNELNTINKRKDNELLITIEYHYYSKSYIKTEYKIDKKVIKLIKEYIQMLYTKMNSDRNNKNLKENKEMKYIDLLQVMLLALKVLVMRRVNSFIFYYFNIKYKPLCI